MLPTHICPNQPNGNIGTNSNLVVICGTVFLLVQILNLLHHREHFLHLCILSYCQKHLTVHERYKTQFSK